MISVRGCWPILIVDSVVIVMGLLVLGTGSFDTWHPFFFLGWFLIVISLIFVCLACVFPSFKSRYSALTLVAGAILIVVIALTLRMTSLPSRGESIHLVVWGSAAGALTLSLVWLVLLQIRAGARSEVWPFLIFPLAMFFAGLYGAVYIQIPYTISPEYLVKTEFGRFHIPTWLPGRLGAAVLGIKASWWVGIPIGLIFSVVACQLARDIRLMCRYTVEAYIVVMLVALATGLFGFLPGIGSPSPTGLSEFERLLGIEDPAYVVIDQILDYGYLGAWFGFLGGIGWLISRGVHGVFSGEKGSPMNNL